MYWKAFFICGEILGSTKAKRDMPQHDDAMMDQEQCPRLLMHVTPSMIISA
jgi:hypothetical protein